VANRITQDGAEGVIVPTSQKFRGTQVGVAVVIVQSAKSYTTQAGVEAVILPTPAGSTRRVRGYLVGL
jgi:hypothetical protein